MDVNSAKGKAFDYTLAVIEAEKLEAQAKALYAKAGALRGQQHITVLLSASIGPGGFGVLTRIGGEVYSTGSATSAEDACQMAYHLIQGYQPELPLPAFGTRVGQTLSGILAGFDATVESEQTSNPKS